MFKWINQQKHQLFYLVLYVLIQGLSNRVRPMPINIDNGLPAVAMRFGISDEKEMSINVHLDSCAGMLEIWMYTNK